jgi:hypothetical protein
MKKLLLAVLLLSSIGLLRADPILKNTDFTDGASNWNGDGKSPTDLPGFTDKGLIIALKPHDWSMITQDFTTTSAAVNLTVSYKLAPSTMFSTSPDDYANVPQSISYTSWKPFKGKVGGWMIILSDLAKQQIFFGSIIPPANATELQTFSGAYNRMIPGDNNTLCLAFPPGTGAVILQHVSLDK